MRDTGPKQSLDSELSNYILQYAQCDSMAEAMAILDEARGGNPAAEYITAMSLVSVDECAYNEWMNKAAAQGFKPALIKVRKSSSKDKRSADPNRRRA